MAALIPLSNQQPSILLYWPMTAQDTGHRWPEGGPGDQTIEMSVVTRILACDWSILVTWPEYWALIGQLGHMTDIQHSRLTLYILTWVRTLRFQSLVVCHDQYLELTFQSQCLFNIFNSVGLISGSASCWWQAGHFEEMRINSLSAPYLLRTLYREGIIFLENYNLGLSSDLTDKQNDDN